MILTGLQVFDKYTTALGVPMEKVSLIDMSHNELNEEPEGYAPYEGFQTKRISSCNSARNETSARRNLLT